MSSLKPKNQGNGESNVDWKAINESLPEDTVDARIAYVVDLGLQKRGRSLVRDNDGVPLFTYVVDEDAALEVLSEGREILGDYLFDKENLDEIDEVEVTKKNLKDVQQDIKDAEVDDEVIAIPFRIVDLKDAQEVAYIADCVDTYVEYIEGEPEKQYRVTFNQRDFTTGKLKGYALSVVPPKGKSKDWTYAPNSFHHKLAKATYVDLVDEDNDVSSMLDKPFGIQITKNKEGYPKFTPVALRKKDLDDVPELDCEPLCITFDEATLEQIQELKPNKLLVEKIQSALDYKGSAMEEALEEYLKSFKSKKKAKDEDQDEEEESPKKSKLKRKAKEEPEEKKSSKKKDKEEEQQEEEKPRRGRKPKVEKTEQVENDEFDEDQIPW